MAGITYREAALDDAALASDLMTAAYPPMPQDPVVTRMRWETPRVGYAYGRFIAEQGGLPVAYLGWVHGPWEKLPDRHCEVEVWLDRAAMDRDLLASMWRWIDEKAEGEGSRLLLAYAGEDETEMLEVLELLGFERARAEKVWELDLHRHGARLVKEAVAAKAKMSEAGVRLSTLAEWKAPDKLIKLYELNGKTVQDVPHTLPILTETYEDFEKRVNMPDRPHDRFWVALIDDMPVALTYLKFPPVRGTVWTGYTCSHPDHRGRGIAKAIKLQSLAQAVELGVPFVCTDNDSENAPMLHINEQLGYHRRPGFVEHHKRVST